MAAAIIIAIFIAHVTGIILGLSIASQRFETKIKESNEKLKQAEELNDSTKQNRLKKYKEWEDAKKTIPNCL